MKEKEVAFFPEWVTDRELFVNYMKDISLWDKPLPPPGPAQSDEAEATAVTPEMAKRSALSRLVGMIELAIVDLVIWCLR